MLKEITQNCFGRSIIVNYCLCIEILALKIPVASCYFASRAVKINNIIKHEIRHVESFLKGGQTHPKLKSRLTPPKNPLLNIMGGGGGALSITYL